MFENLIKDTVLTQMAQRFSQRTQMKKPQKNFCGSQIL